MCVCIMCVRMCVLTDIHTYIHQGVIDAYKKVLSECDLKGPSNLAPILNNIIQDAKKDLCMHIWAYVRRQGGIYVCIYEHMYEGGIYVCIYEHMYVDKEVFMYAYMSICT